MRQIEYSGQFKRDLKKSKKRGKNIELIKELMRLIIEGMPLPSCYLDHQLKSNWSGFRDAHIEPDWLLIYKRSEDYVRFERTGTHSDLFS